MAIIYVESIEEFKKEVYNTKKLILIYFGADWCGPCKSLGPVFSKVSEKFEEVKFIKINVDKSKEISEEFQVRGIPAMFLVRDKNIVSRNTGFMDKEPMTNWIESQK
jgi:thioredoxin 1